MQATPYCIDWHIYIYCEERLKEGGLFANTSTCRPSLNILNPEINLIKAQRPGVIFLRRNLTPGSFFYVEIWPRVIFPRRNLTPRSIFYGSHFSPWCCRINGLVRFSTGEKWPPPLCRRILTGGGTLCQYSTGVTSLCYTGNGDIPIKVKDIIYMHTYIHTYTQ